MYSKFFKVASVLIFGLFVGIRMFVENGQINDIAMSVALLIFCGLSAGGMIFDKKCDPEDRKAYKKFTIIFVVVIVIWVAMLLFRYVFS